MSMNLNLKPDDQPETEDDFAIAIEFGTLSEIESNVLMMNGYIGEARLAVREALSRIDSPGIRRLLFRAQRANDDAIKRGLDVVKRARSL